MDSDIPADLPRRALSRVCGGPLLRNRLLSGISIRYKLPLFVALAVAAAAGAVAWAAYREIDSSAHRRAEERLRSLSDQMVTALTAQVSQQARRFSGDAADPLVRAAIRDTGVRQMPVLLSLRDDTTIVAASVWRADGTLAMTTGEPALDSVSNASIRARLGRPDSAAIGAFRLLRGSVVFPVVVPVRDSGRHVGDLIAWRRQNLRPDARATTTTLLGTGAVLFLGSIGGTWTDQSVVVPSPSIALPDTGRVRVYHGTPTDTGERIGLARRIAGTDWILLIELPERVIAEPVAAFRGRVVAMTIAVILTGFFIAWLFSRHIAQPLAELTDAANHMALRTGETRVRIEGDDELSRLGSAFNRMASHVHDEVHARERSELQWRLLFHANPHPMWVYDVRTLRFLAVNDAAQRQYGYSAEEFLALTIVDIRPEADRGAIPARVAALRDTMPAPSQWRHMRKDGSVIDVEIHSHAVEFDGHEARLVLAHDITMRAGLERQLRQSQKMEAVGRLAGGVAHDFNNLLAVIMAHAELVVDMTAHGDPRQENLEELLAATQRAHALTRQLLTFSRQQVFSTTTVAANDAVRAMARMLTPLLGGDIEIRLELADITEGIRVDPGQFEQVLVNMAVNARDAMPDGGTLTFATGISDVTDDSAALYGLDKPGRYVVVRITDTGAGMTPDVTARVFDPFYTTKEPGKGTGLGLATAYGIVAQSGGRISVYSEVGVGTTFRIFLPAVDLSNGAPVLAAPEDVVPGTERVLLVEDDEAVRVAVAAMVRRLGYTLTVAGDVGEAVALAENAAEPFELVITDVVMPDMHGPALVARLRGSQPDLRALLISGYAGEMLAARHAEAIGLPMIQKPFSMRELSRKIREVLDA